MRFAFRADGSSTIGFGHISRMVALAGAATAAGSEAFIVTGVLEPAVTDFLSKSGVPFQSISAQRGSLADAAATRALAGSASIVVVDGYVFGAAWFEALAGEARTVVYVDDVGRCDLPSDVVLNPNVSGVADVYTPGPHLLVGPDYAIVHERFVAARARKSPPRPRVERLLVTMGASDPCGATSTALSALSLLELDELAVRVVVGAANARRGEIAEAARACTRHRVELRVGVDDMAAEFDWADLVVTASGVTATETACVGVAGVTFPIVDNQVPIAAALDRLGLFEVLPEGGGDAAALAAAVARVARDHRQRSAQVAAQRQTIDGLGKDRIIERLLALHGRDRHNPGANGGEGG